MNSWNNGVISIYFKEITNTRITRKMTALFKSLQSSVEGSMLPPLPHPQTFSIDHSSIVTLMNLGERFSQRVPIMYFYYLP